MVNTFQAYHFTSVGANHLKTGQVCQDASASATTKYASLAVVCDGHGGEDYFRSDRGSRMAADTFVACVTDKTFLKQFDRADSKAEVEELVTQLLKSLIMRWNVAVEADLTAHPLTPEELEPVSDKAKTRYQAGEKLPAIYGTTLIGFVCGERYGFGVQIGDGKCVLANGWGQFYQPIPWDEQCFLNVTTSLSDENAFDECRLWVVNVLDKDFPLAVFLGSDGIDDSFAGDDKLHDFYRLVLKNVAAVNNDTPITALEGYLPTLSAQGSGDDMSLAVLINSDRLTYDAGRWEGSGRQIYIDNSGDMDADTYGRFYSHQTTIPAKVGSYPVTVGRNEERTLEILEISDTGVRFSFRGEEHVLTADERISLTRSEYQASYDGPWHNAQDTTVFTLL